MNEKQAQAVVELAQEGFTKEALVLAKAYNEAPAGVEIVAMPRVLQLARSLLQSIFARFTDNALTKFIGKLAKMVFKDLSGEELEEAKRRTRRILGAVLAVVAVAVVLVLTALYIKRKDQAGRADLEAAANGLDKALDDLIKEIKNFRKEMEHMVQEPAPPGTPQLPAAPQHGSPWGPGTFKKKDRS
jgi:type VI protein secretion system component VasK